MKQNAREPGSYAGGFLLNSLQPARQGPRPTTERMLPHRQLNQRPSPAILEMLLNRCLHIPGVRVRESRMAPQDTRALCLRDEFAEGPADAFIDDHEFCHIHSLPDGSLHMTLPEPIGREMIRLGWGEWHPLAECQAMPQSLVMVYAPRTVAELEMVFRLVTISYRFARGIPLDEAPDNN